MKSLHAMSKSKSLSKEKEALSQLVESLEAQAIHQRSFSLEINDKHINDGLETISLMRWVPNLLKIEVISEKNGNTSLIVYDVDTTLIIASEDAIAGEEQNNEASISEDKIIATLKSTFRVYFHCDGKVALTEKQADVLGRTRCLFDIWPYWREFVSQSCFRGNLPPINFPPFSAEIAAQKHS